MPQRVFAATPRPPILKYNQSHTPSGLIIQTEESLCWFLRCILRAYKLLVRQRPLRSAQWPHRSLVSTVQCQCGLRETGSLGSAFCASLTQWRPCVEAALCKDREECYHRRDADWSRSVWLAGYVCSFVLAAAVLGLLCSTAVQAGPAMPPEGEPQCLAELFAAQQLGV